MILATVCDNYWECNEDLHYSSKCYSFHCCKYKNCYCKFLWQCYRDSW